jgi:hypothetical protein
MAACAGCSAQPRDRCSIPGLAKGGDFSCLPGGLCVQFVQCLGLVLAFRFSSRASVCGVCGACVVVRELCLLILGLGL